jgi:hypothetical protein
MTYSVQRKDRFYVVAYDGLDPLTGKERRRWQPVGHNRDEAELVAAPDRSRYRGRRALPRRSGSPRRIPHRHVAPAQASTPSSHDRRSPRRPLRTARQTGGRQGTGLAPKTGSDVHMIVRASLDLAVGRQLLDYNVARAAHARRRRPTKTITRAWTAHELAGFLTAARRLR